MDWLTALLFLLIVPLGQIVQGVSGFGAAIVAVSSLSLFLPLRVVSPVIIAVNAVVNVQFVWHNRQHLRLKPVLLIVAGIFIGAPIGANLLITTADVLLKRALSVALLVALCPLIRRTNSERETEERSESKVGAFIAGLLGGISGAVFGMAGPPIVLYLNYTKAHQHEIRAALFFLFMCNSTWQTILFVSKGIIDQNLAILIALTIPAALAAGYFGNKLAYKVNAAQFRVVVVTLIAANAVLLWLR